MHRMHGNRFVRVIKVIALVALILTALGAAVMYLWNALLPSLFGVRAISFGEAVGLLVLCKLLFGGWRGGSGYDLGPWAHRYRQGHLTPEERERLREKFAGHSWFGRCCSEPKRKQSENGA